MPSSDASLDDMSSTTSSYDSDEEYRLAQQEWEESLHQLQQLFAIVLLPIFGKWMGRRWSHLGSFTLEIMTMLSLKIFNSIRSLLAGWTRKGFLLWRDHKGDIIIIY
jgi:hypothetical protein